jgi:glyoxylase-like metal-dependent hydrolase (beta-lactamase superfamily II)
MERKIKIKWFPPSWCHIKTEHQVIYIGPSYLRTIFTHYPKTIERSKWPDIIDGLPEKLEKVDIILVTHHHKDHCKQITTHRLRKKNTIVLAPKYCSTELDFPMPLWLQRYSRLGFLFQFIALNKTLRNLTKVAALSIGETYHIQDRTVYI